MRAPFPILLACLAACSSSNPPADTPAPAGAAAGAAAAAASCPIEQGTTVLATEFTSAGERADIALQAGCRYYAETDMSGVTIQLRPRTSGTQQPYVGRLMGGGVQGGSTWEIRATSSGEYQIWATGSTGGRAVKVTVTARGSISK
ncbi:MAG TPA: hypothetical protein VFV65_02500 [Gemmatimonadales bacterium]|nr:hypothetical protein [Gemmatimonadales bacterium]